MSATEREHVMPPRPLIPWTMALCAGMCVSCALVLSIAADALLREWATAVGPLWAIPVAAAVFVVLAHCRVHRHHSNVITEEQLRNYDCPIQIVSHGHIPHTVLEHHPGDCCCDHD